MKRLFTFISLCLALVFSACDSDDEPNYPDEPVLPEQPTEPEGLPEEAKFNFKMVQITPLNNNESPLAAPFDLLTFRIYDHKGDYSYFGPTEFFQYYDSIVVCSPNMPDTYRVYWKGSDAGREEEHFTSQWSSYFYETDDFAIVLKGYKNGEVIYETSETQEMYGRDFLCVDWTDCIVTIANPTNNGVYCILDKRHEFSIVDKQELNGTLYTKLYAKASLDETGNENLEEKEASLQWLLKKHLGAPSSVAVSDFKTLPEGTDVVETYQNNTTRAALLHRPADDFHLETYLAIAEAK